MQQVPAVNSMSSAPRTDRGRARELGLRLWGSVARREPWLWHGWAALWVVAVAAAFYLPAIERTGGTWPVPLDDSYIYFGFARSWALGYPFSWIPGNGYSSGCTSAIYPLLLAPGYALGLGGSKLGIWAATLAVGFLYDLCRSLRAVVRRATGASWLFPPLVLSVPLLDWSWLSGMETALLGALLGRSLLAAWRAMHCSVHRRARRQLVLGGWLALLVLTRPETAVLVFALAVAAVYAALSLGTVSSLLRTLGPPGFALLAQAGTNLALTGEWQPAGAVRKLVSSAPYWGADERATEVLKNAIVLHNQAFERALGGWPLVAALLGLVATAMLLRRYRLLAVPLLFGSAGAIALICWNVTARYQNYRYAAPSLAMLLVAGALGASALWTRNARWRALGIALGLIAIAAPAGQLRRQIDHFARASATSPSSTARWRVASPRDRPVRAASF